MKIDGACHCGAIRYEAEIDPAETGLCHCNDCQTLSGGPWRASVRVRADRLELTGEPRIYLKTAASGATREQAFCGICGSGVYAVTPGSDVYSLRLGAVRQRAELVPQFQIWCDSALPWSSDLSAIPARPRQ